MSIHDSKKLDNPVWHSLNEEHKSVAIEYDNIKFYHPDYCPFGGFIKDINIGEAVAEYANLTNNFFIVGDKPTLPGSIRLKHELICLQMINYREINAAQMENIVALKRKDAEALFQLVNLVQPGYFKSKTFLLGNYYGIFKNNELVAVTGERMKMEKYVEVSAVVTHPDFTGKGYAKQLIAHTVNKIIRQKKIPYLHVAENNLAAIALYEKLGFQTRRKISFWNIDIK